MNLTRSTGSGFSLLEPSSLPWPVDFQANFKTDSLPETNSKNP